MKKLDRVVGALMAVMGIAIAMTGYELGYMNRATTGPGFLPLWVGLGLVGLGLAIVAVSLSKNADDSKNPFLRKEFINMAFVVGGAVGVVVLTPLLGFVVPLGIMTGAYAWVMGTKNYKKVVGLMVAVPVAMFLIFGVGLQVQLPMGIFGG